MPPAPEITVYIASPMSIGDQLLNIQRQVDTYAELMAKGFYPHAPLLHYPVHMRHPFTYEEWLEADKVWVRKCDVLLRLPGESKGADGEVALAISLGKPVFNTVLDLVWFRDRLRKHGLVTADDMRQAYEQLEAAIQEGRGI